MMLWVVSPVTSNGFRVPLRQHQKRHPKDFTKKSDGYRILGSLEVRTPKGDNTAELHKLIYVHIQHVLTVAKLRVGDK
jgi:hypothetical protein